MASWASDPAADRFAPHSGSVRPKRHSDELTMGAGFRRTAALCAIMAFGATSLLALAGADWPPPVGFLWLEGLLAALAFVVYLRVRSRLTARSQDRRVPSAALEGVLASLAAGFVLVAFSAGDPDITLNPRDHVAWILVLGLAGAIAAQALWGLALWIDRISTSPSPGN